MIAETERGAAPAASPSLNEIMSIMRKRLAWYGLPHLALQRLDVAENGHIVAALADARAAITYEEVFDRRTGARRGRTARIWKAA